MRVRVDARREAQEDALLEVACLRDAVEEVDLVEVVDDDARDAVVERLRQLFLRLVVAVAE